MLLAGRLSNMVRFQRLLHTRHLYINQASSRLPLAFNRNLPVDTNCRIEPQRLQGRSSLGVSVVRTVHSTRSKDDIPSVFLQKEVRQRTVGTLQEQLPAELSLASDKYWEE
jgi:hypothetical protein